MHPLLKRQLTRYARLAEAPPDWQAFVRAVEQAYEQSDADRALIERSMEISSNELVQRNRQLSERNAELTAVRETALDCVISIDADGCITEFNPAAEVTFGYRRQDVIGKCLADVLIPPRLRAAHTAGLRRVRETGTSTLLGRRVEMVAQHADGTEFPVEMSICVVRVGQRLSFTAYLRNITERKQYEETLERERDFTAAILETIPSLVVVVDREGRIVGFNRACEQVTGFQFKQVHLQPFWEVMIEPARREASRERFLLIRDDGNHPQEFESQWRTRDGALRLIAWAHTSLRGADGQVQFIIGTGTDITDRKLAEHLERDRAEVLEMVAKSRPLSETLERLVLLMQRQRPGMRASILLLRDRRLWFGAAPNLPSDYNRAVDGLEIGPDVGACGAAAHLARPVVCADIRTDPRWQGGRDLALSSGLRSCWSVPVLAGDGTVLGTFAVYFPEPREPTAQDLHMLSALAGLAALAIEHQKLTDQLAYAARHDPLTGLPNRVLLDDRLDQCLQIARRNDELVGVYFIDLDGFKYINDTLGHHCGDLLLRHVATRLQNITRDADTLARMGGDEFTLIAPQLHSREDATRVARRILEAVREPFQLDGRELSVGASIGVALFPGDGADCGTLQRNADAAMYRAKSLGRNRFEFFNHHMNTAALERMELESQLRCAIANGELLLHYQPLVNQEGTIQGIEALLRWSHPRLGLISPARFIPLAEETGLILPIGAWVLHEALQQWVVLRSLLKNPLFMSINVSSLQFAQADFLPTLSAALKRTGADPRCVELELTESVLMGNPADAAAKLACVREMGVGLAIDDFGTGYSSLAYLHRLPLDTLKIDRGFVQEIEGGVSNSEPGSGIAVIRAIASLAHSLRLRTVAEGVETELQYRFLRRLGCHLMQGYLFSPPVPADELPRVIRALSVGGSLDAESARRPA